MTNTLLKSILPLYSMLFFAIGITAANPTTDSVCNNETPTPKMLHHYANDSFLEKATINTQIEILSVNFKDLAHPNVYFKIKSVAGDIYYSGSTHTGIANPLQLTYNMKDLPPGKYFIQMENEQFFTSLVFEKKDQQNYIAFESR